jgi:hypothetical protein
VQARIGATVVRVSGAKRDDLQAAIRLLKATMIGAWPLSFTNFRDRGAARGRPRRSPWPRGSPAARGGFSARPPAAPPARRRPRGGAERGQHRRRLRGSRARPAASEARATGAAARDTRPTLDVALRDAPDVGAP